MAVIELQEVTRRFGGLTAVDAVSLTVDEGEIVGLIGHNGAGKSTLMRLINGVLDRDGGEIRVQGRDPGLEGAAVRRTTGVLTEHGGLDASLTVRENLAAYTGIYGLPEPVARERIEDLLYRLGLWDARDVFARELSTGRAQRTRLARALLHDPPLWLLDEPTSTMDPVASRGVRELIVEAVRERGCTVLLSTHDLRDAERLCDRIAILRHGRLVRVGTPAALRRELGGARGVRVTTSPGDVGAIIAALPPGFHVTALDDATAQITGPESPSGVIGRLVAAGVAIHRVEPIEPSLEDLYVALHSRQVAA